MQALERSKGGFTTKIHAQVDSFGYPLNFELTGGEAHEMSVVYNLLTFDCQYLIADRVYDSDELRSLLVDRGIIPVIPSKINRKNPCAHDTFIYKERNQIERFFNRIKQFRRIASRFDKTCTMFKGALVFVSILLWLKN